MYIVAMSTCTYMVRDLHVHIYMYMIYMYTYIHVHVWLCLHVQVDGKYRLVMAADVGHFRG